MSSPLASPSLSATMSPPTSPPQNQGQNGPYRTSRNLGASALQKSPSGFFSVSSGTTGRPVSFFRGASSMRSGSFVLNTSAYTRPFKSRRNTGPVEKPWMTKKRDRFKWAGTAFTIVGAILALAIIGIMAATGWASYDTVDFCEYWEDDFSGSELNTNVWTREVRLDGFGTDEFEWTTPYENNSYVKDGKLHIMPTLPWYNASEDGVALNLTDMGICTGNTDIQCAAITNSTNSTYLPPVQSARLNTRLGANIRYGKIEVTARLPVGDWLWPAIWMMPKDSVYGSWPTSGEIDIMESRGNDHSYYTVDGGDPNAAAAAGFKHYPAGNNAAGSALHWGADTSTNRYYKTTNGWHYPSQINDLTSAFHTYGMEWTPNGIRTYVDHELTQIVYFKFPSSGFWNWGAFPSNLANPWFGGTKSTPFDQEFYLILNVAVGGNNGYFADRIGGKPWGNSQTRDNAMHSFATAKTQWLPTWPEGDQRALVVDKVKMWKTCKKF